MDLTDRHIPRQVSTLRSYGIKDRLSNSIHRNLSDHRAFAVFAEVSEDYRFDTVARCLVQPFGRVV